MRISRIALICAASGVIGAYANGAKADGLKLPPGVTASSSYHGYVARGTDYLSTGVQTSFTLGMQSVTIGGQTYPVNFGTVFFQGTAIPGYGGADTIIQRPYDAPVNVSTNVSAPLKVEAVNLAQYLTETPAFSIGGQSYAIAAQEDKYALDSAHAVTPLGETTPVTADTGTIAFYEGGSVPTFNSSFNVDLDLYLVPVNTMAGAGEILLANIDLPLGQTGGTWSSTPPMGQYLRVASDDGSSCALSSTAVCDLTANKHTGLPSDVYDFFPQSISEAGPGDIAHHLVMFADGSAPYPTPSFDPPDPSPGPDMPELSTWVMMLIGFAGLGFAGYRASLRKAVAA